MRNPRQNTAPSIGFVSTYPPTECGIATFTSSLLHAIGRGRDSYDDLFVVALANESSGPFAPEVVHQHLNGDLVSLQRTIDVLNQRDVVVFEHEYGIYGGQDGAEILEMVSAVTVPTVVTLHTVPTNPTVNQRVILERIVAETDQTIVMSQAAAGRLRTQYDLDAGKVKVIPHGASPALAGPSIDNGDRPIVLTWGLIGPGKGLERAIRSFAGLKDLVPLPRFIILGRTHPKVRAAHGDAYLEGLMALVDDLGIGDMVEFDARYLDIGSLIAAIHGAEVILIPYDSREQGTSGVLVEAIAAGKPVVATAFPHAVEMLSTGAGIVVPHDDPDAMFEALHRLLGDRGLSQRMAAEARSIASTLFWPVIADSYEVLFADLVSLTRAEELVRIA